MLSRSVFAAPISQSIDIAHATIFAPADADGPETAALEMLTEEAAKRDGVTWHVQTYTSGDGVRGCGPCLVIGREDQLQDDLDPQPSVLGKPEAFEIATLAAGKEPVIRIVGHDDRGVLFGIGYLLRQIGFAQGRARLTANLHIVTAPHYAVRGHQLGYRFKNNTYDAWTPAQFEQYIRDLAVFGSNTIELLPPKPDDAPSSPLFPLPAMETMTRVSAIVKKYGLRCSIFYPALANDYADPATVASQLREWSDVFSKLPEVDEVFVPGGDPGHTDPAVLFPFLAQVAKVLHQSHPNAGMWVSAQGFNADQMKTFYALVAARPPWLAGIVVGPQSRDDLIVQRAHIPAEIPIRFYPDIAHTMHSQLPVPEWDEAYALTEGREVINPRPIAETTIFRHYAAYMNGFVTYSEGVNDDVNKFIWSELGWSPDADAARTLCEYARYFVGEQSFSADAFAHGLLALEQNWRGPLATNSSVDTTLRQFERMEKEATQGPRENWRFQEALYRAYTDAYERHRLIAATQSEQRALRTLASASQTGSMKAIKDADDAFGPDRSQATALRPWRDAIETLAGELFHGIGLQLSVKKFGASATDRGASLDTADVSLNDRAWFEQQFARIRALTGEPQRLHQIAGLLDWSNPGAGGFYDDLGNASDEPHLVRGPGYPSDPVFFDTALDGIADRTPDQGWRLSELSYAGAHYDHALELRYEGLSASTQYKLRVVYAGEDYTLPMTLIANGQFMIHGPHLRASNPEMNEFTIPAEATRSGTLDLKWTRPKGMGGGGRGLQVAEVWLLPLDTH